MNIFIAHKNFSGDLTFLAGVNKNQTGPVMAYVPDGCDLQQQVEGARLKY